MSAVHVYTYIMIDCVKLFKEQLFWPRPRNTRLPDNNQERRPITIELNLNAVTLFDGEILPVSSLTFDLASSKTPSTIRASPSKRRKDLQKGLQSN